MTNRTLKALDLFCGGGGAALGMIRAGFEVTGIDIKPHHNYPGEFIQGDVFEDAPDLTDFDFVWASPPCQRFSVSTFSRGPEQYKKHPDLVPATRAMLRQHPFTVIENVVSAPIRPDLILSGPMFGLNRIIRKRKFELSWLMFQPAPIFHRWQCLPHERITVTTSLSSASHFYPRKAVGLKGRVPAAEACEAMGIDVPMTAREVGEAIPPVFGEFIARDAAEKMRHSPITRQ